MHMVPIMLLFLAQLGWLLPSSVLVSARVRTPFTGIPLHSNP